MVIDNEINPEHSINLYFLFIHYFFSSQWVPVVLSLIFEGELSLNWDMIDESLMHNALSIDFFFCLLKLAIYIIWDERWYYCVYQWCNADILNAKNWWFNSSSWIVHGMTTRIISLLCFHNDSDPYSNAGFITRKLHICR